MTLISLMGRFRSKIEGSSEEERAPGEAMDLWGRFGFVFLFFLDSGAGIRCVYWGGVWWKEFWAICMGGNSLVIIEHIGV